MQHSPIERTHNDKLLIIMNSLSHWTSIWPSIRCKLNILRLKVELFASSTKSCDSALDEFEIDSYDGVDKYMHNIRASSQATGGGRDKKRQHQRQRGFGGKNDRGRGGE